MSKLINFSTSDEEKVFNKNVKKILFISGRSSYYKTGASKIFEKKFQDKEKHIYIKKSYLPEYEELIKIINIKDKIKPDLIVAIGGGCVIDYAKIASVFDFSKNIKKKLINSDYKGNKKIPLLAIPTTAGSGAEVTSNAVIYINGIKYSVEGPEIRPDYYALHPKLLLSSSMKIDSSSGFDAISQAIESMLSLKSTTESFFFSKRGLKILLNNYNSFLKKKNLINSYQMSLGANFSGKAINISKTTIPHAISYPFTTKFGIPHGHAVSLTFNKFLKFNYLNIKKNIANFSLKKRYEYLFKITKTKNIEELDRFFLKLKKESLLEQNFKKLGINIDKNYEGIIDEVNIQRLSNNPILVKKRDLIHILKNY